MELNSEIAKIEIIYLILNIFVLIVSNYVFNFLYKDDIELAKSRGKLSIFLSSLLLLLQSIDLLQNLKIIDYFNTNTIEKILFTILSFYIALILHAIIHYSIKKHLGELKTIEDKKIYVETHSSRTLSILSIFIVFFIVLYINVQIWAVASVMETTGIIGLTIGALALTNGVWFPDLYSGLLLLKNKTVSIGDIIEIEDDNKTYILYKINFFNIILLDIENNVRVFVPNSFFEKQKIKNFSKIANSQGIREVLKFKIGYPDNNIEEYLNKFEKMIEVSISECNSELINKEFKVIVNDTGDFAIEMAVSIYIKTVNKTFATSKARSIIFEAKGELMKKILINSYKYDIDLSTPVLISKPNKLEY